MSKDKVQLLSPLFLKYQTDYEKNPRSRVFAPLAETYRKLGMVDKAMEILSQGIRFHPTYVMGYLGLAFCYYDLKQYNLAYNTLRPLVETSRDNIRLQKLFADICLELGHREEALDTYKYLLFINPRDKEVALRVSSLERQIEEQYKPNHQPIYIPEIELRPSVPAIENHSQLFDIDKLENRPNATKGDFDDWMALDLSREQKSAAAQPTDAYEFWNLKKGALPLEVHQPAVEKIETKHFEEVPAQISSGIELDLEEEAEEVSSEAPLVTHTLVDLYCGQGHMEKALEVLEKILILNPNDQKTIKKISEIKSLIGQYEEETETEIEVAEEKKAQEKHPAQPLSFRPHLEPLKETSEEDGRKTLMSIFDQQVGQSESKQEATVEKFIVTNDSTRLEKQRQVEQKLTQFLKKIQKRALDYQSRV